MNSLSLTLFLFLFLFLSGYEIEIVGAVIFKGKVG
jgi:hypothetical protein